MSDDAIASIRVPLIPSIPRILGALEASYEEKGDALRLTGLPVRVYCFRDPSQIAEIFRHPEAGTKKPLELMPRVTWLMGTGGYTQAGGSAWKSRRGVVQPAFRKSALESHVETIRPLVDEALDHVARLTESGESIDILSQMQTLITRISFKIFMSEELDGPVVRDLSHWTHFVEANLVRMAPLSLPLPAHLKFRRYARGIRGFMGELVTKRRRERSMPNDLLSHLVNAQNPRDGQPMDDDEIVDELCSVYFGASVMSTTLTWTLALTGLDDSVQETLRASVLEGAERKKTGDLGRGYVTSVLNEAMRLYPPSWGFPRFTEQGMTVGGAEIPRRSVVVPMVYHAQRHPRIWDQPDHFRPERFEENSSKDTPRFAYFPFGGGSRTCLGMTLAPMLMATILRKFVTRFRFRLPGDSPRMPEAEFGFELHPKEAVYLKLDPIALPHGDTEGPGFSQANG